MIQLITLLIMLLVQWILLKGFPAAFSQSEVQLTLNFSFLLLTAYLLGELSSRMRLPKLSGYLLAGIFLGPDVMSYFSQESVESLVFIDELALTYIALSAGLELRMEDLRKQVNIITSLTISIPLFVFAGTFFLIYLTGPALGILPTLPLKQTAILAALMGTIAIARSPSSTIAVIKETKAKGAFSETVLGVTVVMDILVIVLFSIFLSLAEAVTTTEAHSAFAPLWVMLPLEIFLSFLAGLGLAWFMSYYSRRVKADRTFFLLCSAFLVTRLSSEFSHQLEAMAGLSLHLEPLLICMSAGFFLQNYFQQGSSYEDAIDRSYLPVFVIFFSLAGTRLDIQALFSMWPFALLLTTTRATGVLIGAQSTVWILKIRSIKGYLYGISFLTQAGVSLGLATMIPKRFPGAGDTLFTLLLAVIVINQLIGPIAFKFALEKTGEARTRKP